MTNEKPLFKHECAECKFIATVDGADVYLHHDGGEPQLHLRFADEPTNTFTAPAHVALKATWGSFLRKAADAWAKSLGLEEFE